VDIERLLLRRLPPAGQHSDLRRYADGRPHAGQFQPRLRRLGSGHQQPHYPGLQQPDRSGNRELEHPAGPGQRLQRLRRRGQLPGQRLGPR